MMEQRISYTENRFGFGTKKLLLLKEMVNYSACLCCNDIYHGKWHSQEKKNKYTTFTIWAH